MSFWLASYAQILKKQDSIFTNEACSESTATYVRSGYCGITVAVEISCQ